MVITEWHLDLETSIHNNLSELSVDKFKIDLVGCCVWESSHTGRRGSVALSYEEFHMNCVLNYEGMRKPEGNGT